MQLSDAGYSSTSRLCDSCPSLSSTRLRSSPLNMNTSVYTCLCSFSYIHSTSIISTSFIRATLNVLLVCDPRSWQRTSCPLSISRKGSTNLSDTVELWGEE